MAKDVATEAVSKSAVQMYKTHQIHLKIELYRGPNDVSIVEGPTTNYSARIHRLPCQNGCVKFATSEDIVQLSVPTVQNNNSQ